MGRLTLRDLALPRAHGPELIDQVLEDGVARIELQARFRDQDGVIHPAAAHQQVH